MKARYEVRLCAGTDEQPHTGFETLAEAQAYCRKSHWRFTDETGRQWGLCIAKVVQL